MLYFDSNMHRRLRLQIPSISCKVKHFKNNNKYMDIARLFESILFDIENSDAGVTRRKVKTIFSQLGAKTTSSQKIVDTFNQNISKYGIEAAMLLAMECLTG